jgi:dipeptidyl aminopeptidase/acylaminoacyl peptidase
MPLPTARSPRLLLAAALLLSLPFAAFSQTPAAKTAETPAKIDDTRIASLLDDLARVRTPTSVSISPDGNTIAYAFNGANGSELHLTPIAPAVTTTNGADHVLSPDTIRNLTNTTPGICASSHPNWSPDGKQLAFLSGCTNTNGSWQSDSQDNLFLWTPATNDLKQVSHLHGAISDQRWSPDGKSIAFLFVENATRHAGALDAMKPWNGVYGEDGVEVQRVYSVSATTGAGNFLTPANLHIYEFTWNPVASWNEIAFIAANPPGENTWWVAKLYTKTLGPLTVCYPGQSCSYDGPPEGLEQIVFDPTVSTTALRGLQIAVPRFSPNGERIAFIGGLMSDQGSTGGDIWVLTVEANDRVQPSCSPIACTAPLVDVTPNRPSTPAYIAWLTNNIIGLTEHVGGSSHITALNIDSGKDVSSLNLTLPETIIAGTDVMSVSIARKGLNIALIRQSFDHPPEVWAGPLANLKQITHLNDTLKPAWGRSESIDYTNEGFHIQGWLLYPANYDAAKKYPLIVSVHGGPSSAVTPRWPTVGYGSVPFSALGYFDFMPNPRGSYGQGEKFTQANIKDFGYGDLRDVLAGIDILEKRFPIDRDREGITGWSYGGFMTMFAVTQTTRFKAAVAGAGLANWQSYYGENSIDQWMIPFFGATVYDDPAVYAKSSPITFIKRVKTPTLMVVGDRDGECPAPQSFEFWHALRDQGIKTQLVLYPNEGHHFVSPDHQRDVLKRAFDWFETEMPPE